MSNINNIFVSTSASFFLIAKNIATRYGWMKVSNTNEPWMVFDIHYRKVSFTFQPPNTTDSSVLVATSPQDITNNMPPLESAMTPLFERVDPLGADPYAYRLTIIQ